MTATTISDTERREVARRLRGDPFSTLIPYRTGIHFGMGCHEAANRFWDMCERIKSAGDYDIAYSTCSVLADLIEPSCDRDALLALADEMEYDADVENAAKYDPMLGAIARMQVKYANRIRKALEVEP